MNRRAYTIVEAIVVLAIVATLVGLMWPFITGISEVAKRSGQPPASAHEPHESVDLSTVRHDGHWFVKNFVGGVCHHPNCPCLTRKVEVER